MIVLAGVAVKGFGQTTPVANADLAVATIDQDHGLRAGSNASFLA